MTTAQTAFNPFALMMDPESVLAAMARSERLNRLQSRVCRPLDKPFVPADGVVAESADEVSDDEADSGS
jgi:hypothetical protein